jgi:hypothetical protein
LSKNNFMKTKISIFLLIVSTAIYSQKTDPIQADRPDQTETPAIVPKGMYQVETGFTFEKNDMFSKSFSLPSTLWKYGVNKNLELRLITEFILEEKTYELTPLYVGFKIKLAEEKGIIPKTSFIAHLGLPNAASSRFKTNCFAPEFRFTMQHTLSDKFSLGYNLGAEWDGFTALPTFIYTITSGYTITKKLGVYGEFFGYLPQNCKASHLLDGGFTYLINNNFMVDLSSGLGLTKNALQDYFAFGFSFRL